METEQKPKRVRRKAEYVVEFDSGGESWRADVPGTDDAICTNAARAVRWIKNNGEKGATYRVIRVVFGPVKVEVVPAEKRRLV